MNFSSSSNLRNYVLIMLTIFYSTAVFSRKKDDNRLRVYVFFSTSCPISKFYCPEIKRLNDIYRQDIDFCLVFPFKTDNLVRIHKFKSKNGIRIKSVIDYKRRIVNRYFATTTPEVVILKYDSVIYSGALDNAFVDVSLKRSVVSEHYLFDALSSIYKGDSILIKHTIPIGCIINQ